MSDLNPYEEGLAIDLEKVHKRIEELEELLAATKKDAEEAEAHALEVEAESVRIVGDSAYLRGKAEGNLDAAMLALKEALYLLDPDESDMIKRAGVYRIVTTYERLMKQNTGDSGDYAYLLEEKDKQ